MPDITMCEGKDCVKRDTCFRYRARPSERQSYSDFYNGEKPCIHYWNIDGYGTEGKVSIKTKR